MTPKTRPVLPPGIRVGIDDFNTIPADTTPITLPTVTAAELCAQPDLEGHELLGPLISRTGRTIIVGDTGHGKTTLALQLVRAVTQAEDFCGYTGTGNIRALVLDLEQGARSAKRALREAGLEHSDNVDIALIPDGLALDKNQEQLQALTATITLGGHQIVLLDPYYKAHQADDPNSERPIVDLMRQLDALRTTLGFALLLPAHPRKQQPENGAVGARRLTIHDIAGSGAVTRGAEVVLGIERLHTGYARLRFLKDRDGDLPVGEAWGLTFTKTDGYQRDPRELAPPKDYMEIVTNAADGDWHTVKEYSDLCGDLAGEAAVKKALTTLVARNEFEYAQGPPGRDPRSKCYRPLGASDRLDAHDAHDALTASATEEVCASVPLYNPRGVIGVDALPTSAEKIPSQTSDAQVEPF